MKSGLHRGVSAAVLFCAALLLIPVSAVPLAEASPLGTKAVRPALSKCGTSGGLKDRVACGAARRDLFLRSTGSSGVVRETVLVDPGMAWLWWSQAGPTICGYSDLKLFAVGAHHCDRTTFIVPRLDEPLLSSDVRATTVLIHESAHGIQERLGQDPVLDTLLDNVAAQKPRELAADCWAGAGIRYLIARGELSSSSYGEAAALIEDVGDPRPGMLHGTSAERRAAFEVGFRQGSAACARIAAVPRSR